MSSEKHIHLDDRSETKKISVNQDPVGRHIIALRTFYCDLVNHKRLLRLKKYPGPAPRVPEYPSNYPTVDYLKELRRKKQGTVQRRLNCKCNISKEKVDELIIFAIKSILLQNGFHTKKMKNNDKCLTLLSDIVHNFLESFFARLCYHKDSRVFSQSQDVWNPLETTLQEIGFQGVSGIAKYFYEDFVKMGDTLYNECIKELQLINIKYPIQNELPSSSVSPDLPSTSNFLLNSLINPDLPSTPTALSNSSMCPVLPSTSTALPDSLMSPDLLSTSIALSNFSMCPDLPSTSTTLSNSSMCPDLPSTSIALSNSSMCKDLPSTSTALSNFSVSPDLSSISTAMK